MGANASKQSPSGRLLAAVAKGDEEVVSRLLKSKDAGKLVAFKDANGQTALHIAAGDGQENFIITMLAAGADAASLVSDWHPLQCVRGSARLPIDPIFF
jgi:ankyrin repeat protein